MGRREIPDGKAEYRIHTSGCPPFSSHELSAAPQRVPRAIFGAGHQAASEIGGAGEPGDDVGDHGDLALLDVPVSNKCRFRLLTCGIQIATGSAEPLPWPEDNPPLTTPRPPSVVFAFYRAQCERSNAVLAATPLSTPPRGRHPGRLGNEVTDLRRIVLHMIEETARHAGHLDVARELLDGRTGLGPR
ncbi:MAG TPA: DUF664 domain-containing protein [Nonomuraea sp.]|nr:DUF664 domain-containing protein [Nonomuraea sp.]